MFSVTDAGFLTVLLSVFGALCAHFAAFTIDDAYITFRYAKHLAAGNGILWNLGQDPVEGYTSTLWVLISAIPHVLGLDPVLFAKLVGVLSTVIVIIGLYGYGLCAGVRRWVIVPVCATLALNPAVAVLSVQGMETSTAMVFVLLSALAATALARTYRRRWVLLLYGSLLLGMLTRPGLVIYAIGLLGSLAVVTYYRSGIEQTARLTAWGGLLLFLPGVAYMAARIAYFGYPLPNSFYVKQGESLISPEGRRLVVGFLTDVIGPLLLFGTVVAVRRTATLFTKLRTVAPLFVGSIAFLLLWLFISPLQGYLWRFQTPVFPAFLVAILVLARENESDDERNPSSEKSGRFHSSFPSIPSAYTAMLVTFALLVTIAPLHILDDANHAVSIRQEDDRVHVGQALHEFSDTNYRMFVSEAGAVPYYSEWMALDYLGLNSEYIAHYGLDQQFLERYDPDLVMMLIPDNDLSSLYSRRPVVATYLEEENYRLVAVVNKTGPNTKYHAYFVDPDSNGFREIACELRTVPEVSYASIAEVSQSTERNRSIARLNRSTIDCRNTHKQ